MPIVASEIIMKQNDSLMIFMPEIHNNFSMWGRVHCKDGRIYWNNAV